MGVGGKEQIYAQLEPRITEKSAYTYFMVEFIDVVVVPMIVIRAT